MAKAVKKRSASKKPERAGSATKKKAAAKSSSGKTARKSSAAKKGKATKRAAKASPKKAAGKKRAPRKWSAKVTRTSDAMDLKPHIFESRDPVKIARSVKRSSENSKRKKGTPFQSAMSMLNFYLNRAGKNLSAAERKPIEKAKDELRKLFHRE